MVKITPLEAVSREWAEGYTGRWSMIRRADDMWHSTLLRSKLIPYYPGGAISVAGINANGSSADCKWRVRVIG